MMNVLILQQCVCVLLPPVFDTLLVEKILRFKTLGIVSGSKLNGAWKMSKVRIFQQLKKNLGKTTKKWWKNRNIYAK